jgi:hypothetical protein
MSNGRFPNTHLRNGIVLYNPSRFSSLGTFVCLAMVTFFFGFFQPICLHIDFINMFDIILSGQALRC